MSDKPRVVVCAALRIKLIAGEERTVCGARHYDRSMYGQLAGLTWTETDQGFIDQFGVFMTREGAYEVAKAAGQIKYRCGGDEGVLFSENLY